MFLIELAEHEAREERRFADASCKVGNGGPGSVSVGSNEGVHRLAHVELGEESPGTFQNEATDFLLGLCWPRVLAYLLQGGLP